MKELQIFIKVLSNIYESKRKDLFNFHYPLLTTVLIHPYNILKVIKLYQLIEYIIIICGYGFMVFQNYASLMIAIKVGGYNNVVIISLL